MESFTMEIEKDKREELDQVQETELSNSRGTKALHSEADLSEREDAFDENLDEEHHKHVDYSNYTKSQFVALVKELAKETNFKKVDIVLKEVKPLYDEIREKERSSALQKLIAEGGEAADFEYKGDDLDSSFDANLKLIRDRRAQYFRQQEEQKNDNLRRKQELIEKLRILV